jgi:pimeloyl-ACP methyl ester carboxylesterase
VSWTVVGKLGKRLLATGTCVLCAAALVGCGLARPQVPDHPPSPSTAAAPRTESPGQHVPPTSMLVAPGRHAASCGPDDTDSTGCNETITMPGGARFEVYANYPMAGSAAVTQAVIVVHGTNRNADGYYEHMMAAAVKARVTDHVMVVAPHFEIDDDDPSGMLTWPENDAWKRGADSENGLSSFAVIDELVASLSDSHRFPRLQHITIAGHSAGGQFAQRYAAFGKAPSVLPWESFSFAIMNPSSYVYLDDERPGGPGGPFVRPAGGDCPDYDHYKYGLAGRTGYPGELSARRVVAQYATRSVTIFSGGDDTVDNGDMDTKCPAMLQGADRFDRATLFHEHFMALHPQAPHARVVVPGVGHHAARMFASPLTWPALFGAVAPGGD